METRHFSMADKGGKTSEEAFAAAFGHDVYEKIIECIRGE